MNVKELLKKCQRDRTAVLATNFYNFETLTAVMQAAQRMQAPVLLQLTRSSINYMGLEQAVGMGRRAIADYGDRLAFGRKCLCNTAAAGPFSSDRTIALRMVYRRGAGGSRIPSFSECG